MKRIAGVGGIFFTAKDPEALNECNRIELWEPRST